MSGEQACFLDTAGLDRHPPSCSITAQALRLSGRRALHVRVLLGWARTHAPVGTFEPGFICLHLRLCPHLEHEGGGSCPGYSARVSSPDQILPRLREPACCLRLGDAPRPWWYIQTTAFSSPHQEGGILTSHVQRKALL